jgi:DNA primase
VVVTETALDALSYAQMEGMREDTAYVSMAGNPSEDQLSQLRSLCGQPRIQTVVLAHDKDKGGDDQAEKCRGALAESPAKVERETPASGKDWNEMLQSQLDQEKQEQLELIRRMEEAQKVIEKAQVKERSQGRGMSM